MPALQTGGAAGGSADMGCAHRRKQNCNAAAYVLKLRVRLGLKPRKECSAQAS